MQFFKLKKNPTNQIKNTLFYKIKHSIEKPDRLEA